MAIKLWSILFGVAIIYWKYGPIEAMLSSRPLYLSPPPTAEHVWRMNLPPPLPEEPLTISFSLDLYDLGLHRDPCTRYCTPDVSKTALIKDCGEVVEAMAFLAQNKHGKVKPECASAREHTCKWSCKRWGFVCSFKITVDVQSRGQRRQKEKEYTLSQCSNPNA